MGADARSERADYLEGLEDLRRWKIARVVRLRDVLRAPAVVTLLRELCISRFATYQLAI